MESLEAYTKQKKKANRITLAHTAVATGLGFVPFPLLDAAGILGIQLWMLGRLAKVYDVPFKKNLAKSIIGTLVGNIGLAGTVKLIPGLGSILGGGVVAASAGAATYALGKLFTQHFSQGGTLLSFDPVKSQEYFRQLYEEGKITVKELKAQENGFAEVHSQALASTSALKQANEELRATIATLQNQLEQSKKDRKFAVVALQEKKGRRFRWFWLILVLVMVVSAAAWIFQAGYFKDKDLVAQSGGEQVKSVGLDDNALSSAETEVAVNIDSTNAEIAPDTSAAILVGPTAAEMNFAPGSAEAAMADYMSAPEAVFPRAFTLDAAQFEEGAVKLTPEAEAQIANIAALLRNHPAATLRIYGHADQNGGTAVNRQAGRNRARVIQEILEQNGVERRRISATYREIPAPPDGTRGAEIEIVQRD